jgi:excisionase family DNA binding protein
MPADMTQELYSVEQVAAQLGLHVRTVRNYVRNGRLKAIRIGKQYRIAREHLEALTGGPSEASGTGSETPRHHVEVSSIVQIEGISVDAASRVTNALMAAAKSPPETAEPLRIDPIYDPERARLKVILTGSVATTASLLKFIAAYVEP